MKLVAILLAFVLVFSLIGCGGGTTTTTETPAKTETAATEEKTETKAEEPAAETEEAPAEEREDALPTETPPPEQTSEVIGDGKGVTLRLTFSGEEFSKDPLYAVLQEFFDETGISTEVIYVPSQGGWAGYFSKIQTMIAANDSPDMIRIAIEGFRIFQEGDLILPIDDYMDKYPETREIYNDMHPNLLAPFKVDGKLYGLTFDWNNVVTHINTNIVESRGVEMPSDNWTYDQFIDFAKQLTYTDDNGQQVYGAAIPNYYFAFSAWLFNNNASILNEDWTKCTLNTPEAKEVMQKFYDMIYVDKVAPVPPFDSGAAFMNNQVAMTFAGRWPLKSYTESGFDAVDIRFLPTMKTNKVIFGSGIFPILKASKYPEEAFRLAAKLSSAGSQKKILEISHIPSSISVMDELIPTASFPKNSKIYRDSADISKAVESPAQYADIQSTVDRYMSLVLSDEMIVDEAMDQCAAEIDSILAE